VGRRSEEGLTEHTQHSPPCGRNRDESYHSPAMVPWHAQWSVVCRATRQPIRVSGVILMQITYTDNGAAGAHGRMPV